MQHRSLTVLFGAIGCLICVAPSRATSQITRPVDKLAFIEQAITDRLNRYRDSTLVDRCSVYRASGKESDRVAALGPPASLVLVGPMHPDCGPMAAQPGAPRRFIVDSVYVDDINVIVAGHAIRDETAYTIRYRYSQTRVAIDVWMGNFYDAIPHPRAPYKPPPSN